MLGILLTVLTAVCVPALAEVEYNVTCSPKVMIVSIDVNSSSALVYLEKLKSYTKCEPERNKSHAVFRLPLDNIYACGTTRMLNKITGEKIYYHRVIVEIPQRELQIILVRCVIAKDHNKTADEDNRTRRNTLPENFSEPELLNITDYITAEGPVPYLNLAVRQHGRVLDTTLNVQPGTPLEMLIYLDEKSSDTYGLLTSYLKVTDSTPDQEEVIIMNGCSIDPYIFGNFEALNGGNSLSAKFRAFKFPDSNYVLFVGTVNVCLQQCKGVLCGNDQIGYGRRRRAVPTELPADPNKIFEVEMTAFIKVQYGENHFTLNKGSLAGKFGTEKEVQSSQQAYTQNSAPFRRPSALFLLIVLASCALLKY